MMEFLSQNSTAPAPAPATNGSCDGASYGYGAPVPWIGFYVVSAALAFFFCMSYDLVDAFIHRKPFVPCKLFQLNAITLTVLGYAIKLPLDLTTCNPTLEDRLSKLTSTAFLCTSLGFYVPSLGTIAPSERYGNLAALSVTVINLSINFCTQMAEDPKSDFQIERLIVIVCILLMLLLMWSSAIAFRGQTEFWPIYYRSRPSLDPKIISKDVQGLRGILLKFHVLNYTGNPQTLLCETSHHHAVAFLCTLSSVVVFKAILGNISDLSRSFHPNQPFGYQWTIPYIISAQTLAIAVGTFAIIYRWFSFFVHTDLPDVLWAHKEEYSPERELEHLKLKTLSLRLRYGTLTYVFLVVKDLIMDVLIRIQIALYTCSSLFIGCPIYVVKKVLEFNLSFMKRNTEDIEEMLTLLKISGSEIIWDFTLSSQLGDSFDSWISHMAIKDMIRWTDTCKKKRPEHLIQLISQFPDLDKSECFLFKSKLETEGKKFFSEFGNKDGKFEYRVSCVSLLVLSGFLEKLMPSAEDRNLLNRSLDESFEIIDFVDHRPTVLSEADETRWTSAKELWAQWENPIHWFQTKIISQAFKKKYEETELKQNAHGILEEASSVMNSKFRNAGKKVTETKDAGPLASKHKNLVRSESVIISKFLAQEHNLDGGLSRFLKMCYVKMLYCFLSSLPMAILKEIDGDDPTKIGEDKVSEALKLLAKLELLGNQISWSWTEESQPANQENV